MAEMGLPGWRTLAQVVYEEVLHRAMFKGRCDICGARTIIDRIERCKGACKVERDPG